MNKSQQEANREILKEKEIEKREEEAGIQEPKMISGRPNLQDDREWTERIMNNMYHAGWEKGISEERARWKKKIEELKKRLDNPAHEIRCSSYQVHGIIDEVFGKKQ